MRFAVIQFGGSNCDQDTHHALQDVCGVDTDLIWYKEGLRRKYDAIVIPGGFSYGDYLRAGAIAARTPIMQDILRHVRDGRLLLGICNGAQIGAESGFVPGTFTINAYPKFICRWVRIRVENAGTPFTSQYREGEVMRIPIAHKEGRYIATPADVAALNKNRQIAFRFCDETGDPSPQTNPNGSVEQITGVLNERKNVLLMMPHPERASEKILGSEDGKKVFLSIIDHMEGR
ncbi:MAG: phosphoribosylformylglycinamidine synthase I [Methanomicrobiales archaeon]|nr:phosphoribosylformylglycinamidine synthase I [Methanomicrobiales archaeon]